MAGWSVDQYWLNSHFSLRYREILLLIVCSLYQGNYFKIANFQQCSINSREYFKERRHFFVGFPCFFKEFRYSSTSFRSIAHNSEFLDIIALITKFFHCFHFKFIEFQTPSPEWCLFRQLTAKVSYFKPQNATNSATFPTNFADKSPPSPQIF